MADQAQGYELPWDGPIEHDSEFTLLPDGEYDFEVISFDRQRHNGSDKLPPCNKAALQIRVTAPDGQRTQLTHNFFLHSSTEGFLCAFFASIEQRKHGERLVMNWGRVPGARGRCKVGTRTWISQRTGEEMKSNEIKRFLYPEDMARSAPAGAPTFEAGRF